MVDRALRLSVASNSGASSGLPLAAPAYVIGYVYADLLEFSGPVQIALRDWLQLSPQAAVLPTFVVCPVLRW